MVKHGGDYYYDRDEQILYLLSETHPISHYEEIEIALEEAVIEEYNTSHVTYEDLSLKYSSGHGIGGGLTEGITVRNLDISYIGGGAFLHEMAGEPVRYGNGIEFWSYAKNNLVEGCTIYEIFDTGVTNQNNGKKAYHENIIYRDNTITNCGMASFEVDNQPSKGGLIRDVIFENNICRGAGGGWAATQDRFFDENQNLGLGHHVTVFYINTPTDNLIIRNNVFEDTVHDDGLGSMYLFNDIEDESGKGIKIYDNEYNSNYDHFAIIAYKGGDVTYLDDIEAFESNY